MGKSAMIFTGFNGTDALEDFVEARDLCSYCNQPLVVGPFILWKFHHCEIWLHRNCAIALAMSLQRDSMKALKMDDIA